MSEVTPEVGPRVAIRALGPVRFVLSKPVAHETQRKEDEPDYGHHPIQEPLQEIPVLNEASLAWRAWEWTH